MRSFMETIAKQLGFDPLVPDAWYTIDSRLFYKLKVKCVYCANGKRQRINEKMIDD